METTWLEDFVVLVETRSFSRAAQLRHVTQPAFSRRIQALEAWVGLDLLDRTIYPPALTKAGEHFHRQAQELLNRIGQLRLSAGEQPDARREVIRFALPHTLSLSVFPSLLHRLNQGLGPVESHIRVGNVLDVVLWLVERGGDILLCYHHAQQPILLDPERYEMLTLGQETLAPYSAADAHGEPLHAWPGAPGQPVPFLAYTSTAYLSRMTDIAVTQGPSSPHIRRVFDTDMAEGLRRMAVAGHGVAFLPGSLVQDAASRHALRGFGDAWQVSMDIRAYRERPSHARPASPLAERIWRWLGLHMQAGTLPLVEDGNSAGRDPA